MTTGYSPSPDLLRALQNVPVDRIATKPEDIAAFNPCPSDTEAVESGIDGTGQRFMDATAPYTLAVEIAVGIAACWTPTDDWVYKMLIPPNSPGHTNSADASTTPAGESASYASVTCP